MSELSSIIEVLGELNGRISDEFRSLSNGFQKSEEIKKSLADWSRQMEDFTDKMRDCKRLIKDFDREVKDMESINDENTARTLNDKKKIVQDTMMLEVLEQRPWKRLKIRLIE